MDGVGKVSRPVQGRRRLVSIFGGSIGNLVEWYDFYAYSAFALYFAPEFFPSGDRTSELLGTAAVFAAGFLMRPLGAWWMGIYGDRHGRKAGLTLSLLLMFSGSAMIALAPTYAMVGPAAPVILLIARLLQGLSVGGEYGASATYLSEMAEEKHRGFWASFQYVTLIGGQLCALLVVLVLGQLLSEGELQSWGWRIPFLIGGMLALLACGLRRRLEETDSFKKMRPDRPKSSLLGLWCAYPGLCLKVAIISGGGGLTFYAYTTYMQKFLVNTAGFSRGTATQVMTTALVVYMLAQPVAGYISDRIGRRSNMFLFSVAGTLATVPAFGLIAGATTGVAAFAVITGLLLILSAYTSISGLFKAELFPPHLRTLGVAFPYAIGNALLGGTSEYVALSLKAAGFESAFYWYVAVIVAVTGLVFATLPETKSRTL